MLNLLSPSVSPSPPLPPFLRRRRGGQPANRNALIHGLYAVKNRTPLTDILTSLPARQRVPAAGSAGYYQRMIQDLQEGLCQAYQKLISEENHRSKQAWFNTLVRMVALMGRLKADFFRRFIAVPDLQFVTQHAQSLIHNSFVEKGHTCAAYSFRENTDKSDFNSLALEEALCQSVSRYPFPFLTPRQWAVLAPLVPPAERTGKRGRPSSDPRILLDAIFWKLAHHARWQDLPPHYPSMLTCRRYYRRLLLSGRLDLLFTALYHDLLTRGKFSLPALVEQGAVAVSENRMILRRGLDKSWQMRTALLFLQHGYQALRRSRREDVQERKEQHPTLRMLLRKRALRSREIEPEKEFSFTPINLADLGYDFESVDKPSEAVTKKALLSYSRTEAGEFSFTPIDLAKLDRSAALEDAPHIPLFTKCLSPSPPLVKRDPLYPNDSYSPAVPNTQSQRGELTP